MPSTASPHSLMIYVRLTIFSPPVSTHCLVVEDMLNNPFETQSDSFYFVDNCLVMHNKASYQVSLSLSSLSLCLCVSVSLSRLTSVDLSSLFPSLSASASLPLPLVSLWQYLREDSGAQSKKSYENKFGSKVSSPHERAATSLSLHYPRESRDQRQRRKVPKKTRHIWMTKTT
jgi:hypothetical protein